MPEISDHLQQTIFEHPDAEIWVADSLTDFADGEGGTLMPHLYLLSLNLRAAPDIDSAEIEIRTGIQIYADGIAFSSISPAVKDLLGKTVKVRIPNTIPDIPEEVVDAVPAEDTEEEEEEIADGEDPRDVIWFGRIGTVITEGVSVGSQRVAASGVLKMAEQHFIHSAFSLDDVGTDQIELGVGLSFNVDATDQFGVEGNRAADKLTGDSCYLFAFRNRGAKKWTSYTAVEYLLWKHSPLDTHGDPSPQWVYDSQTFVEEPNDWYECRITTEGKSLKQLLDELIPRKRAMSYWCYYDDTTQTIKLRVFTFVNESIELYSSDTGDTRTLPANTNQVTVDCRDTIWITEVTLSESTEGQYDTVIGRGDLLTSTCTLALGSVNLPPQFVEDWTTTTGGDQDLYKSASSTSDKMANAKYRLSDSVQHIFSRFKLYESWNGKTFEFTGGNRFWAFPEVLPISGTLRQFDPAIPDERGAGLSVRVPGIRLLRKLPLKERVDYSADKIASGNVATQLAALVGASQNDTENIPPALMIDLGDLDNSGASESWVYLDHLSAATEGDADKKKRRHWSVSCVIAAHEPSLELRVVNHCQTLIARDSFLSPTPTGVYDDHWDPVKQNGFEYSTVLATVCLQAEHRLTVSRSIVSIIPDGRPERILNIEVADCRRDYVVPYTIVGIKAGVRIESTSGGYIRDDRPRLVTIVEAAAEWYGRVKRAFECSYKQTRKLFEIGTLITEVDGLESDTDINTPVTAITYSMGSGNTGGTTKIETGFAEIDFS
jgi:hypothetical protein